MGPDAQSMEFCDRREFRTWLDQNRDQEKGLWIRFTKGNRSFSAQDALEEALCFGWIDGVMKSLDEKTYQKYFSRRKDVHKWSDKNIGLYHRLTETGLMTDAGVVVFQPLKKEASSSGDMTEKIETLRTALANDPEALRLFDEKAPSRRKQFAGFYGDAKTDETRTKRRQKIVDALRSNDSGMLY